MKIKEEPVYEQPRERLMLYGVENLSDADLISIIIRTGTKDINVKDVAMNILNNVGSINNLGDININELVRIKGVGRIKAITLIASVELGKRISSREINVLMSLKNPYLINNMFKKFYINEKQEKLLAIFLDTKKTLISYKIIFVGTIDKVIVHPREIYREAIKNAASSVVIMHNHPSGEILPSKEDIDITKRIYEIGKLMEIPLLDHIISNGMDYYSFREHNII